MIFNLPKKEDRNLLYELYYIHGICFAKLMGPKERKTEILPEKQTGRENFSFIAQRGNKATAFVENKKNGTFSPVICEKMDKKSNFQWTRVPTQRGGRVQPNRSVLNKCCNLR